MFVFLENACVYVLRILLGFFVFLFKGFGGEVIYYNCKAGWIFAGIVLYKSA